MQLSTSWGSFCSSTLLIGEEGSWEGAGGAWERGPALFESGDPSLQVCRGGGAAAAAAPPSPVEERSPGRYFGQRLGCLMPDWFYLCCQRDGGEKRGGLRRGLGSAVSPRLRGPCSSLSPICTLCPSPVCSALKPLEPSPRGAVRGASRGLARGEVAGERRRWQTAPNCRCPPREHPWQSPVCDLWSWNALEAVFPGRVLLRGCSLWLPRFLSQHTCVDEGAFSEAPLGGLPPLRARKPESVSLCGVEI